MRWLKVAAFLFLLAYAGLALYAVTARAFGWPVLPGADRLGTVTFFAFALIHAGLLLSWRNALAFWAISFVVSLAFESLGVLTGVIYGPYHYGDRLGYKVFGLVPLLIPMAWFMMMYASHCTVNVIAGAPAAARRTGAVVWLSLAAALAMTAWDLSIDPNMARWGAWVWEEPGPYFGIPLQNYLGWLETTFVVFLLYRLFERRWPARAAVSGRYAHLPLAAYATAGLVEVLRNFLSADPAIGLIIIFAMGSFVMMAVARLLL